MGHRYQTIKKGAHIDETAKLGNFIYIGKSAFIHTNVIIAHHCTVGPHTFVRENTKLNEFVTIGEHCSIKNDLTIGNHVTIGNYNVILAWSVLSSNVSTGRNVQCGQYVNLKKHVCISDGTEIGDYSIIGSHTNIGFGAKLQQCVYVGKQSSIGDKVKIGKSTIIHDHVEIPRGVTIKPNQIIICYPSSLQLYEDCIPFEEFQKEEIDIVIKGVRSAFNENLRKLIDLELKSLNAFCFGKPDHISIFGKIKSLYLIWFHGINKYKRYSQKVSENKPYTGQTIIIENVVQAEDPTLKHLKTELHFILNCPQNNFDMDVRIKLLRLLAIEQELKREDHFHGIASDNKRTTIADIMHGERKVLLAKRHIFDVPINNINIISTRENIEISFI